MKRFARGSATGGIIALGAEEDADWEPFEGRFRRYRKKVTTQAVRISGPFEVATSEGVVRCEDGWLCIDARGFPYPVAADEFALIYERPRA